MKKLLFSIIACGSLAFIPTSTHADVLSFSFDSGGYLTAELDYTGTLGLFDSSLGTLTGAILTFDDVYQSSVDVTNLSASQQSFRIASSLSSFRTSSLSAIDNLINGEVEHELFNTGLQVIAANGTARYGPYYSNDSVVYDLAAYLNDLQVDGGGNFTINLQTLTSTSTSGGGGNISSSQATEAALGGTITYTYTPIAVPEPSSFLMVFSVLGTFLLKRGRGKI